MLASAELYAERAPLSLLSTLPGAWRSEWAELYAENLEQSGAARVSGVTRDAAWVAEHEPLSKWLSKLEGSDIAPLVALGAPRHEAEALRVSP